MAKQQPKTINLAGRERPASRVKGKPMSGFAAGMIGGGAVLPLGALATIIMPIVGIPMLAFSLLAPFVGLGSRGGTCPSCAEPYLLTSDHITCRACHHTLVRRGKWMVDVT